jgi:hypothetical protein
MTVFFRQLEGQALTGNLAALLALQQRFREQRLSGLMEVKSSNSVSIAVVVARGETAGTYLLQEDTSIPINLIETIQTWEETTFDLRSLPLSDVAARLLWLVLDSRPDTHFEIHGSTDWQDWLNVCKDEGLNSVIEIRSEACDGFFYLQNGQMLETESAFAFEQNLYSQPPAPSENSPWHIKLYIPRPESLACQSLHLRLGAAKWFQHTLNRYQRIAGQRITQILTHNLENIIREWEWKIHPQNNALEDQHFFARPSLAADAYRALFMRIGEQMDNMLGNQLTQRLLNQGFEQVPPIERSVLTSHRLLPAAFVD